VEQVESFLRLIGIMRTLRSPEGCPWDREQTHETLKQYCIEEAYEVVDAIDHGDPAALKGELGDLLLQIVFHAQLAQESGKFNIVDVVDGLNEKLVRRHPHVFCRRDGDRKEEANTSEEVLDRWGKIKKEEGRENVLDGIPRSMPALQRAARTGEKAARVGFDWKDSKGVLEKVMEEFRELDEAGKDPQKLEEEFGDLLLSLASLARHLKLDPEGALRKATDKFEKRFRWMEQETRVSGIELSKMSPEDLDALWNRAKQVAG